MGIEKGSRAYRKKMEETLKLRKTCAKIFERYGFEALRAALADIGYNPRAASYYINGYMVPSLPATIALSRILGFDLDEIDPYIRRGIHFARLVTAPGAKNWVLPSYAKKDSAERIAASAESGEKVKENYARLYSTIKFGHYFDGIGLDGEGLQESNAKIDQQNDRDKRVFRWIVRNFGLPLADTMRRVGDDIYMLHGETFYDYKVEVLGNHVAELTAYWRETGSESTRRRIPI